MFWCKCRKKIKLTKNIKLNNVNISVFLSILSFFEVERKIYILFSNHYFTFLTTSQASVTAQWISDKKKRKKVVQSGFQKIFQKKSVTIMNYTNKESLPL